MNRYLKIILIIAIVLIGFFILRGLIKPAQPKPILPANISPDVEYRVALLGDSLAAGEGASDQDHALGGLLLENIQNVYPKARLTNLGIGGAVVHDVVEEEIPKLTSLQPSLVFVVVGTNDITHGQSPDQFTNNYKELVARIAAPDRDVVLLNIPKFSEAPAVPSNVRLIADFRTRQCNRSIIELTKKIPSIRVFDLYSLTAKQLQPGSHLLSGDGFHPNDQGYALLANTLINSIK